MINKIFRIAIGALTIAAMSLGVERDSRKTIREEFGSFLVTVEIKFTPPGATGVAGNRKEELLADPKYTLIMRDVLIENHDITDLVSSILDFKEEDRESDPGFNWAFTIHGRNGKTHQLFVDQWIKHAVLDGRRGEVSPRLRRWIAKNLDKAFRLGKDGYLNYLLRTEE